MLRIDREEMIDDVKTHSAWRQLGKTRDLGTRLIVTHSRWHKACENDDVGIVTFDLIGLLPTNHIIILQWHTGVYKETFNFNIKIAEMTQNSWNFIVGKSSLMKKW